MKPKTLLVPYDGSKYSERAFQVALDLANKTNKKLKVVTCVEIGYNTDLSYDSKFTEFWEKELKKKALKKMEKLIKESKKTGVPISCNVVKTLSVSQKLVSFSKSKEIEMIVIGSHSRTGISQLLLGSVANKLVHLAKCPVLVVK